MLNRLLKMIHRPERGWDPIPDGYSRQYAAAVYRQDPDDAVARRILDFFPKHAHPTLLDLGAGPGHYSLLFARHGFTVTWHDVSARYLRIARERAKTAGADIAFSLGYLENARGRYDAVFVSQCWCYCINDRSFARKIVSLLKPGGIAYLSINADDFFWRKIRTLPFLKRAALITQFLLNDLFNVKIGHPHPSHRKIRSIFSRFHFSSLDITKENLLTIVVFRK